jgi:ABC-type multidrug transport system fused ATPase/permease subunit
LFQDEKGNALNAFDPLYWFAFMLCLPVLSVNLNKYEAAIIRQNIRKHRTVFWITLAGGLFVWYGISISEKDKLGELVSAMLAPSVVTGTAWFAISFGGVQEKLLKAAIDLTKWMFAAFILSLVTMAIALIQIVSWPVAIVVCFIIGLVIFSAITYDNVDSLKIGLDDALRRHSLTMLYKLYSDGIETVDSDEDLQRLKASSNENRINSSIVER